MAEACVALELNHDEAVAVASVLGRVGYDSLVEEAGETEAAIYAAYTALRAVTPDPQRSLTRRNIPRLANAFD
jgi:hypothetical protein